MKIQKLYIHNIASIENAELDFNASPLADSDVFLITGPTGSGKSTILDAICLALYGTTPRLSSTQMQGAVDVAGKDVQLNNPAQLLRKTTAEGFVKLLFEGTDGVPYEAEWSISRSRGKVDGRIQSRKWALKDLHSGMVYTKEAEINAEINKAVGLSFDQFCRTTMLAQGQFTRFLDSKDEEKAEILEMITGADIYSKIGAKVFEISREKENDYKNAVVAIQGISLLTDEEKAAKAAGIEEKTKEADSLDKASEKAREKADWLDRETALSTEREKAESVLKEAKDATETGEFKSEDELVRSYRETSEVRASLSEYVKQSALEVKAKSAIDSLSETYRKLREGQLWLLERKAVTASSLDTANAALEKDKPISRVLEKAPVLLTQLDIAEQGMKDVRTLSEGIEKKETDLHETLTPAYETARVREDEAKKKKEETAQTLITAEKALEAAKLEEVRSESSSLIELAGKIALAKDRIKTAQETGKAREKEKGDIEAKEKEIAGKMEVRDALKGEVSALEKALEATERVYDAECSARENVVGDMRRKLQVGDFCPVCMQKIVDALPTDAEVAERLRPIEEAFHEAKKALDSKQDELNKLEAAIHLESEQLSKRKKAYEEDTSLESQMAAALRSLKECGIDSFDGESEYRLGEKAETVSKRKEEADKLEIAGKLLETNVREARRQDELAAAAYEAARKESAAADTALKDAKAAIDQDKAVMEAKKKAADDAALIIEGIVKGTAWEEGWRSDTTVFRQEVKAAVDAHEKAVQMQSDLEKYISEITAESDSVGTLLAEMVKIAPSWASIQVTGQTKVDGLSSKASALKDNLLVENRNLTAATASVREAWGKVSAFLEANPAMSREKLERLSKYNDAQITALENKQKTALNAVKTAEGALSSIESQIKEHAGKKPAYEEGETAETLRAAQAEFHSEAITKSQEVALLESDLKADEDKKKKAGDLAAKADALRVEYDKWARLNNMIGDSVGKNFRKIAQSYVLGSLVTAANYYMKELSDRYTLEVVPGTFVILLEDAYQGFEKRPACTGSGGEGFLVSLALALALSDIGDSLSVDTLFIDEGFGTLSGEPLQNAINTLKTLRKKAGRHVGIISHVEEVREKIPVKIMLEMDNRTASSSLKVVPEE